MITELKDLEAGEHYQINSTKKVLYWDGNNWLKPVKDRYKRYTYIGSEPVIIKNFKYAINVKDLPDIAWEYKPLF